MHGERKDQREISLSAGLAPLGRRKPRVVCIHLKTLVLYLVTESLRGPRVAVASIHHDVKITETLFFACGYIAER
jgi:hypothetical protein